MKSWIKHFSFLSLSCVLAFFIGEIGCRVIFNAGFALRNYLGPEVHLMQDGSFYQHDSHLGWVPKPNQGRKNFPNACVTLLEDGLRATSGSGTIPKNPYLLAVGDSFTFGDQVCNEETWPSVLEKRIHKTVVNGGVSSYGVDQTYLRTVELVKKYKPKVVVVSLILDDIPRAGFSFRQGAHKPYFVFDQNQLRLRNVPTPKSNPLAELGWKREILGYSFFIHTLALRLNPNLWLRNTASHWTKVGLNFGTGEFSGRIFCTLMGELKSLEIREGFRAIVLIQNAGKSENATRLEQTVGCIQRNDLELINVVETLNDVKKTNPSYYKSLFQNHMTPKGNALIAEYVASYLEKTSRLARK